MNEKSKILPSKPRYVDTLAPISKARYIDKIRLIDNKDPYEIAKAEWSTDVNKCPDIQYPDIVNYLVNTQSAYTLSDMKAYKSLESYNYFVSGWVKEMSNLTINSKCLVSGKKVVGKPVEEIDFTSAKSKKKRLDALICNTPLIVKVVKNVPNIPPPSVNELADFFEGLYCSGTKPALLSLVPGYAHHYVPKSLDKKFPLVLSELRDENFVTADKDHLLENCREVFKTLTLNDEEVRNVELETRNQANSREWHRFRIGRITASRIKAVCHASNEKPPQSLIKAICYPETVKLNTKATKFGCDHEKEARKQYIDIMRKEHENFFVKENGLVLNKKYPHLGASPDGLGSCDCCGDVCIEIKCPFGKKDSKIDDTFECLETFGGQLRLKRKHQYYYQVQCHLLVSENEFCDFIVWTEKDCQCERIPVDNEFCQNMLMQSKQFFESAILPELIGKLYSRPTISDKTVVPVVSNTLACASNSSVGNIAGACGTTDQNILICICQTLYNPDTDDVIGCDDENCPYMWFHFKCMKIKRVPKGAWICPVCRNK
ncbi:hypothetical protein ACJMK2_021194 [Sinanodonta woodiana]|uniref:PHD-type domain-containing protein n=1 Tax=Sinanodonta woodiana TaxID=1069815 RepID=A0ABD3U2H6_SINWO